MTQAIINQSTAPRPKRWFSYASGIIFPHKLTPGHMLDQTLIDILARRKRQVGNWVRHITGIDCHSQEVLSHSRLVGKSPSAFCDEMAQEAKSLWQRMGIAYDHFVDTRGPEHRAVVEDLLHRCRRDLVLKEFEENFCGRCETPKRHFELEGDNCRECGDKVQSRKLTHYTFDLNPFLKPIIQLLERTKPPFLEPDNLRQRVLKEVQMHGLGTYSISRPPSPWGIPFPFTEGIEAGSVVWTWVDSLAAELTGIGYLQDMPSFEKYWPHYKIGAGRDIVRFEGLLFPALLMSAGLPLPLGVAAHGLVNLNGQKMSASRGIGLDLIEKSLEWGSDAFRWYVLRTFNPHGNDWEFDVEGIGRLYQEELREYLLNPLQTLVAKWHENFGGPIPPSSGAIRPDNIQLHMSKVHGAMNIEKIWSGAIALKDLFRQWHFYRVKKDRTRKLIEQGQDERAKMTFISAFETARSIAVLAWPFLPNTSLAILKILGIDDDPLSGEDTVSFELQPHVLAGRTPRQDIVI